MTLERAKAEAYHCMKRANSVRERMIVPDSVYIGFVRAELKARRISKGAYLRLMKFVGVRERGRG